MIPKVRQLTQCSRPCLVSRYTQHKDDPVADNKIAPTQGQNGAIDGDGGCKAGQTMDGSRLGCMAGTSHL